MELLKRTPLCTKYHTCNHLMNNLVMGDENIVDIVKMRITANKSAAGR